MHPEDSEDVDVPQAESIDKVVDVPVVMLRQVPMIQKVRKIVEIPHYSGARAVLKW